MCRRPRVVGICALDSESRSTGAAGAREILTAGAAAGDGIKRVDALAATVAGVWATGDDVADVAESVTAVVTVGLAVVAVEFAAIEGSASAVPPLARLPDA